MPDQSASVTVYRTSTCPYCVAAVQLLDELGVAYEEVSLDRHPNRQQATGEVLPGHTTVPLVVIGDTPIGGYQELMAMHAQGELQARIFGA